MFAQSIRSAGPAVMAGILLVLLTGQAAAASVVYNGAANYIDVPVATATDSRGNVIVTGYSASVRDVVLPKYDIVIIKYAPDGTQKWAFRYDGSQLDDMPTALLVDSADNIYVCGKSRRSYYNPWGNWEYNDEYVVIRVNAPSVYRTPFGDILQEPASWSWAKRYDDGVERENGALAVADDGAIGMVMSKIDNVDWLFVTGLSKNLVSLRHNILTLRIEPSTGNVFDSAPRFEGAGQAYARGIAADNNGHIFVVGQTWNAAELGYDFVTIRYSNADLEISNPPGGRWPVSYDGYGRVDDPVAIKVRGTSVYVTGVSYSANNRGDFITLKYNSAGNVVWSAPFGAGFGEDRPTAMAIDSAGNVYVTGRSDGGPGYGMDFMTLKYDVNGNGVDWWSFDGQEEGSDVPTAIAIDGNDRVYVAGYSWDGNDMNYLIMRLNMNGGYHWQRLYDSGHLLDDQARALAVTTSGMVYVTGKAENNLESYNILTRKYRWDGLLLW